MTVLDLPWAEASETRFRCCPSCCPPAYSTHAQPISRPAARPPETPPCRRDRRGMDRAPSVGWRQSAAQARELEVAAIIGGAVPARQPRAAKSPDITRNVFVVYGHDEKAKTELQAMLRRWDLDPLILDQLTSGGQTIIEKLESIRSGANFGVVWATPDDEGHRRDHPEEKAFRARQNVVLELGMMLAVLGGPRVAVLLRTDVLMDRSSDIQELIYVRSRTMCARPLLRWRRK